MKGKLLIAVFFIALLVVDTEGWGFAKRLKDIGKKALEGAKKLPKSALDKAKGAVNKVLPGNPASALHNAAKKALDTIG